MKANLVILMTVLSLNSFSSTAESWKWFHTPGTCEDLNGTWKPVQCFKIFKNDGGERREEVSKLLLDFGNLDEFYYGEYSYFRIENTCESIVTTHPGREPFQDNEFTNSMDKEDFTRFELDEKERYRSVSIQRNKLVITDQTDRDGYLGWAYGPSWARADERYERIEYSLNQEGQLVIRNDLKVVRPKDEAERRTVECIFSKQQ